MSTASPKVVILGSGSLFFGRKAIWQMVHSPHLQNGTLGLVDIIPQRAEKMARLAQKVIAHNKSPLRIEWSTNRRDVLKDADFVVLSFAVNNAQYRGIDCELSAKYGIRMCSGDTIGPGGILRTMRELPEIFRACDDILELAPNAWVINYINPTAVHGIALQRYYPQLKSFALCDAQYGLHRNVAAMAGVPNDAHFELLTAGPNHFTWLLKAQYKGRDVLPAFINEVRKRATEDFNKQAQGGAAQAKGLLNNAIALELYETLGAFPTVTGHTKEYVMYYQGRGLAGKDRIPPLKLWEVPDRIEWTNRVWQRVDDYLTGQVSIHEFDTEFGPDPATDIIEAMWGNLGKKFFINVPNRGAVPNLSDDAFVELYCDVDMTGPRPHRCPPLPRGIRGLCEHVLDTHELTAHAVREGSRDLLRRAFLIDPLTVSIGDTEALMNELLNAERDAIEYSRFAQ